MFANAILIVIAMTATALVASLASESAFEYTCGDLEVDFFDALIPVMLSALGFAICASVIAGHLGSGFESWELCFSIIANIGAGFAAEAALFDLFWEPEPLI